MLPTSMYLFILRTKRNFSCWHANASSDIPLNLENRRNSHYTHGLENPPIPLSLNLIHWELLQPKSLKWTDIPLPMSSQPISSSNPLTEIPYLDNIFPCYYRLCTSVSSWHSKYQIMESNIDLFPWSYPAVFLVVSVFFKTTNKKFQNTQCLC